MRINLLDCTLRDGGYYNNWNFDLNLINVYLEAMASLQIDFVEIGFMIVNKKKMFTYYKDKNCNFSEILKISKMR